MPARCRAYLPTVEQPQIVRLELQAYGPGNYPAGRGRLTIDQPALQGFEAAFEAFKAVHPQYTLEQFFRYIVTKGVISASHAVRYQHVPPPKRVDVSTPS